LGWKNLVATGVLGEEWPNWRLSAIEWPDWRFKPMFGRSGGSVPPYLSHILNKIDSVKHFLTLSINYMVDLVKL
jgi:hypothetical protein